MGCSSLLLWLARSPDVPLQVASPGGRAAAMPSIRIDELRFHDLAGSAVSLTNYFQNYALVIFLRHLA